MSLPTRWLLAASTHAPRSSIRPWCSPHTDAATGAHTWRNVNSSTATYLPWIAANGYSLSPVERPAAGLPVESTDAEATGDIESEASEATQAA